MTSSMTLLQNSSLIWLMAAGVVLGALHALEPGHAKTMIAAFIVATRGSVSQAVLLGLSAAVSHSLLIWGLALAGLYLGDQFIGDDAEPELQIASGALIVAIGATMAWRQWRAPAAAPGPHGGQCVDTPQGRVETTIFEDGVPPQFRLFFYDEDGRPRPAPAAQATSIQIRRPDGTGQIFRFRREPDCLASTDDIGEPHEFQATLRFSDAEGAPQYLLNYAEPHDHGHDHAHGHGEDAHARAHRRQYEQRLAGRSVTSGEVVLFGLGSGLMPCPAALTMLLVCLHLKKVALGLGVVTAFSLGLAITLVMLGVVASATLSRASRHLPWLEEAMRVLPLASSAIVMGLGVFTTLSGYVRLP